jgi:hypothetical protein
MTTNYTKRPQIIPNGHKVFNGHKIHPHLTFKGPSKYTQIGIFGLKTKHLATLVITPLTPEMNFLVLQESAVLQMAARPFPLPEGHPQLLALPPALVRLPPGPGRVSGTSERCFSD